MWHFHIIFLLAIRFADVTSENRMFGGTLTEQNDLGYVVHLKASGKGICTGCIIHESWVLSAAHCVCESVENLVTPRSLTITAGSVDVEKKTSSTQIRKGKEILVHEKYVSKLGKPDLSLIRVNETFKLDGHVKKMPFYNEPWPDANKGVWDDCVAAGWGQTDEGVTTQMNYLTTAAKHGKGACPCIQKFYMLKRYVCLPHKSDEGICFGDSGGALICGGKIVGVAHIVIDKRSCSYSLKTDKKMNCGSPYVYGIFIYTCPYLNWIRQYVPGVPETPESCKAISVSSPARKYLVLIMLSQQFIYFYYE